MTTEPFPTDAIELTKKLVLIPSFVDDTCNETQLVEFLMQYARNVLPWLSVERQYLSEDSKRANVIIRGKGQPKLFVLGHMDTVRPKDNWSADPLKPIVKDSNLYGLGASDMKGSLAAFLCALAKVPVETTENLMVLLYCDEEYDFAGIKRFLETQELSRTPPKLILSLDGSLAVSSGCRGLIEFDAAISGKSGHSRNPSGGINVITNTVAAIKSVEAAIAKYQDDYLGISTINLAYLRGGTVTENRWQREGNVIPDFADITVELRTANEKLDAQKAVDLFQAACKQQGVRAEISSIRHDLKPWPVSYSSDMLSFIEDCYRSANVPFQKASRKYSGFIDVQMICEKVNSPAFVIGAEGGNKHGANEYVPLDTLEKATELYKTILLNAKRGL